MAYTNADWAATVLSDAGLPQTENNIGNIMRWMVAEEPTNNWFHNNNPLNINAGGSGSDSFATLNASAAETAVYLNMPNYKNIRAALANNADPNAFSAAVVASPWAAGHYGGSPSHIAQIPVPSGVNAPVDYGPGVQTVTPPAGGAVGSPGSAIAGQYGGISVPVLGTIVSGQQEMVIKGWFFIIAGGVVATVGMAVLLTAFGLESKVGKVVAGASVFGRAARAGEGASAAAATSAPPPPDLPPPPSPSKAYKAGSNQATDRELTSAYNRGREDAGEPVRYRGGRGYEGAGRRMTEAQRKAARRERAAQPF